MTGKRNRTDEQRFFDFVERTETCWLWRGYLNAPGYGQMKVGDRAMYAHRWAYEHFVGPIPEGLEIDHLCRVPACCNPAHLEAVTRRVNVLRSTSFSAIHAAKTHCPANHPYDAENTRFARTPRGGLTRRCRICTRAKNKRSDAKRRAARRAAA